MRGGFDRKDKRRASLIVGICIGEGDDQRSLKMMLDEGEVDQLANIEQHGATLSVNNPVSNEVEVFLNNLDNEGIESDKNLYGIQDNTVVTLSSINEFDKKKDWLAQQLVCNTSSSDDYKQDSDRTLTRHLGTGNDV